LSEPAPLDDHRSDDSATDGTGDTELDRLLHRANRLLTDRTTTVVSAPDFWRHGSVG